MNDPSFAFGRVYEPLDVVEANVVLLQARLATKPKSQLTLDYIGAQFASLLSRLEDSGEAVITAYAQPTIPKDVWLTCQLLRIEKFREDAP